MKLSVPVRLSKRVFVAALCLTLLIGCVSHGPESTRDPIVEYSLEGDPSPGTILDTRSREIVETTKAFERLGDANVIFVGEEHNHPGSHRVQFRILKALHRRQGEIGVGFELFRDNHQNRLTRFAEGTVNFETLKAQLDLPESGSALLEAYRPLLQYARENDLPLRALKPTREAVQKVRERSEKGDDPLRDRFGGDTVSYRQQRQFLKEMFKEHVPTGRGFKTFLAVQRFWEERMVSNLHKFLKAPDSPDRVLVLTGNYHVAYDFALPVKLRQKGPWSHRSVVTLPVDRNLGEFLGDPRTGHETDVKLADLIWWVEPAEPST